MKIVRDILSLGSTLATRSVNAVDFVSEAGASYASDWREERQLEQAQNKFERAKKWDALHTAVAGSVIDPDAKAKTLAFLDKF